MQDIADQILRRVGTGPAYISIDIDVLDPAQAPATGTPEVGGINTREFFAVLRRLTSLNIVGGDGQFFDRFIRAVSLGQAIDGAIDNSNVLQGALKDLDGNGNGGADLATVVGGEKGQTLAAVLGRIMGGKDDAMKAKLQALLAEAKKLGVDKLPP